LGYSESAASTYDGIRQWAASCYKFGPNVTLWSTTIASKLAINQSRVTGVEYVKPGGIQGIVTATKEVLLCSGAQGSPKLLLLR